VQPLHRALRLATSFALFHANGNRRYRRGENNKMTKYPSVSARYGVLYKFLYSCSSLFLHRIYIYIIIATFASVMLYGAHSLFRVIFFLFFLSAFTHTHTYIYIYIYVCLYVCVNALEGIM
jgi:hypothetical protein